MVANAESAGRADGGENVSSCNVATLQSSQYSAVRTRKPAMDGCCIALRVIAETTQPVIDSMVNRLDPLSVSLHAMN